MGVLDFLFEGRPPTSVRRYGQTVENIPKWLSDYTQGLIARANVIAAQPYQAYEGPRIASFSPDQSAAFSLTRQNVGRAQPLFQTGIAATQRAIGTDPLGRASPLIQAASQTFPQAAEEYMNPYVQNVLNRQEALAKRTLEEDFLPSLQHAFVGAGQFGSERMLERGQKGLRDITEGLEQQRLATMADAYNQSAAQFGADASRFASLAPVVGNLATQGAELDLRGAQQLGVLGEAAQSSALRDAAALEAIGQQQQQQGQRSLDLAYQDFQTQRDYPQQMVDWLGSVIRGLPSPRATTTTSTGPFQGEFQPSGLAQLASLGTTLKGLQELQNTKRGGHIRKYAKGGLARALKELKTGDFIDV